MRHNYTLRNDEGRNARAATSDENMATTTPPSGNSKADDGVAELMRKAAAIKAKEAAQRKRKEQAKLPKQDEKELSVVEKRNKSRTKTFRWAWTYSLGFFAWLL